jgi:hypothetical protein
MGGGPDLLGQCAQRGQGRLADQRMHLPPQAQHADPHPGAAAGVPADQGVLLQGGQQPVDHGAVDAELFGQLGDGQAVVGLGQQFEDTQSPVERLRGLCGHDAPFW